jgi:uroporphyrinogen decarboxylase
LDKVADISADYTPLYPVKTIEETDEYIIYTTGWGVTLKNWTHIASTPEFLDYKVTDRESWADAKARMTPSKDRVDWNRLKKNYKTWREEGRWLVGGFWFGFDVTHSWMSGTERILMALLEDPEWCVDMFNTFLDMNIAMMDMIWDAGYTFDEINWPDDMGYKGTQFFSIDLYRELVKPVQKRAIEWAHAKGIKARLHSCGDIKKFVPELIGIGLDGLNPLEVKAGVDPVLMKSLYGDKLLLHGGVNAVLWDDSEAIIAEIADVVPKLKENGGYIFASDHSIPSSVSLENFIEIIGAAKKYGAF